MGTGVAVNDKERLTHTKMNLKLETVDETDVDGQFLRLATGSLNESGQNSKIFSWRNTVVSAAIVVHKILVDITTPSTAAAKLNAGHAATEIASDNMIDAGALDAALVLNSMLNGGTNGEGAVHVPDDEWITGFEDNSADPADLVGKFYIFYTEVAS